MAKKRRVAVTIELEWPYDGIIARVTPPLVEWTRRAGVPLVNTWFNSWVTDAPVVAPDFAATGRMAAEHLIARGFRQFGFAGYTRQRVAVQFGHHE